MLLILFLVQCTVFEIFAILPFSDLDEIHIFSHNSKPIGRSDLKQEPLDCSRRAAQKCYVAFFRPMHRFRDICVIVFFWTFWSRVGISHFLITLTI